MQAFPVWPQHSCPLAVPHEYVAFVSGSLLARDPPETERLFDISSPCKNRKPSLHALLSVFLTTCSGNFLYAIDEK